MVEVSMKASDLRYKPRSRGFSYLLRFSVPTFLFLVAILVLAVIIGPVSWLTAGSTVRAIVDAKDRAAAINATRQMLLACIAGFVATIALGFTARTYYLTRRGQITDRFGKAVAHLASEKLAERIGGIYSLEHIMLESEREHENIIDLLSAFVRNSSPSLLSDEEILAQPVLYPSRANHASRPHPSADVQAALTVLGRRPKRQERLRMNLSGADLRGAHFGEAYFEYCYFSRCDLRSSYMRGSALKGAVFADAHLEGVNFIEANLSLTDLNAFLSGANLTRANLSGSNLAKSTGVTEKQLRKAISDRDTIAPTDYSPH